MDVKAVPMPAARAPSSAIEKAEPQEREENEKEKRKTATTHADKRGIRMYDLPKSKTFNSQILASAQCYSAEAVSLFPLSLLRQVKTLRVKTLRGPLWVNLVPCRISVFG